MKSLAAILGVVLCSFGLRADADVLRYHPGVHCKGLSQDWQYMYREERGIANFSTVVNHAAACAARPVDSSGGSCGSGSFTVQVDYDDESTTDYFFCVMYKVSKTGTVTLGTGRYACAAGGCPNPTISDVGTGSMTLPSIATSCADGTAMNFGISCVLPPRGTPGTSFLIKMTSQTPS